MAISQGIPLIYLTMSVPVIISTGIIVYSNTKEKNEERLNDLLEKQFGRRTASEIVESLNLENITEDPLREKIFLLPFEYENNSYNLELEIQKKTPLIYLLFKAKLYNPIKLVLN